MSALPLETPFEDEAERFTPYSYAAIVPQRGETYAAQAADIAEQIRRQFKGSGRKIVRQTVFLRDAERLDEVAALLDEYKSMGVRHIVALRGDIPSGTGFGMEGLRYANELVALVKQKFGNHFHTIVAAYPEYHPQSQNAADDLRYFVQKVNAGADSAITQYFFNADAYFNFVDDAQRAGVDIPIIPGIIPVDSFTKLVRFSDMCGAEIPRWLRLKLYSYADDAESIRAFSLDVVTQMCERLLQGGAPGLHFYTLNRADLSAEICKRIYGAPAK